MKRNRPRSLTGVEDLDAHLVCLGWCDLDVLELEWLACIPADGSLALDNFSSSVGHDSASTSSEEISGDTLPGVDNIPPCESVIG